MALKYIDCKLTDNSPVYNSGTTWSGNMLARPTGIQFFSAQVQYIAETPADVPAAIALFQSGQLQPTAFDLGAIQVGLSVSIQTAAAFNAGASVISLQANGTALVPGQYVQFNNHNKIYRVVSSTATNVTILPSLRVAVPASTTFRPMPRLMAVITDDKLTIDEGYGVKVQFNVREQW